jgi:hypothetical protein
MKSKSEVKSLVYVVLSLFLVMKCYSYSKIKHNRPLWVAVQGLIRPTPYTYSKIVLQLIVVPPGEYPLNRFI